MTSQYACTVEPCDVSKVKNALVKFVYCVTDSTVGVFCLHNTLRVLRYPNGTPQHCRCKKHVLCEQGVSAVAF
jgi:hypothetical protein